MGNALASSLVGFQPKSEQRSSLLQGGIFGKLLLSQAPAQPRLWAPETVHATWRR
jgi:hypothetical protein